MHHSQILGGLAIALASATTALSQPDSNIPNIAAIQERSDSSNRTVCGTETSTSGLKTNYFCEGDKPVCCRDSTTTLDKGIPWGCIPADALCCGHGDYCTSRALCARDGQNYVCRSSTGFEVPSLVGGTPELDFDRSGVKGDNDDEENESPPALNAKTSMVWIWGIGMLVKVLFL